jgi:hypothetical protein
VEEEARAPSFNKKRSNKNMANPQLGDNQQVQFGIVEFDDKGLPATPQPGDTFSASLSDSTAATVEFEQPPAAGTVASGLIVAVHDSPGLVITYALQHISGPPVIATDTIDIVGGAATTIAVTLGTPVAQP